MMHIAEAERALARAKPGSEWSNRAARHRESALRAMDDLARRLDNIETEGEATYKDGMNSCSAAQLSLAALQAPDSHMNGGTLRY